MSAGKKTTPRTPLALALIAASAAVGCTAPPVQPDLQSRSAIEKVPGIADTDDDATLSDTEMGALIRALDHPDPAVRFFAFRSLNEQTGQDFDYVYYRDPRERRAAADRWRAWYKQQSGETLEPSEAVPDDAPTPNDTPDATPTAAAEL
ncbi:MAG: hypothetical protein AAF078_11095 [Planctomycetota bacterium]